MFGNSTDEIIWKVLLKLTYVEKESGDLAVDKRKENKGQPPILSVRQKQYICHTKILQEEIGNFCVKRIKARAGIPPYL